MKALWLMAALMIASQPAHACYKSAKLELGDIQFADIVVVGNISNYKRVLDPVIREERAKFLADPEILPELKTKWMEDQTTFSSDYARFDVLVNEVLLGEAPTVMSVTWHNLTFGEPEAMPVGPYLIAIRASHPDPGYTGTRVDGLVRSPDQSSAVVLQTVCSEPFIFSVSSKEARAIRTELRGQQ